MVEWESRAIRHHSGVVCFEFGTQIAVHGFQSAVLYVSQCDAGEDAEGEEKVQDVAFSCGVGACMRERVEEGGDGSRGEERQHWE